MWVLAGVGSGDSDQGQGSPWEQLDRRGSGAATEKSEEIPEGKANATRQVTNLIFSQAIEAIVGVIKECT